ncbi:MAG: hypothetical protein CME06_16705 [Gemmatimonadetes bacterium]|nr:hypothetical protein [Gemmatimonadota bacterium]
MSATNNDISHRIEDAVDWRGRRRAAIELGWEKPAGAYGLLVRLLRDQVLEVRQAAVFSLGRLGDYRAIRELTVPKILSSKEPVMRLAATGAIGELGGMEVVPPLAEKLSDPEWTVRLRADEIVTEKLSALSRSVDGDTVQMLIRLLDLEHKEVRKTIIATISKIGNLDYDQIFRALKGGSPRIQTGLIEILGNIGYGGFTPVLLEHLGQGSRFHQIASARALGRIRSVSAIEGLVAALDSYHQEVALEVSAALVEIGDPSVDTLLEALAHTTKKHYQIHLIRGLGRIGAPRSIPALIAALSNSYSLIRRFAVEALSAFDPADVIDPLLELVNLREVPIDDIISDLDSDDNKVRWIRAVRALGEIGSHRAVPTLKRLLSLVDHGKIHVEIEDALCKIGCSSWARAGAVQVLENLGDKRAIDAILKLVSDESYYVRHTAVVALRRFRSERIIPVLLRAMSSDRRYFVRAQAATTLGGHWTDRDDIFFACMKAAQEDTSFSVRADALRVLARYMDRRSLPVLLEGLGDERFSVRENAAYALENLGPSALPEVAEKLRSSDEIVRIRALRILAKIRDAKALELIEDVADGNSDTQVVVVEARMAARNLRRRLDEG